MCAGAQTASVKGSQHKNTGRQRNIKQKHLAQGFNARNLQWAHNGSQLGGTIRRQAGRPRMSHAWFTIKLCNAICPHSGLAPRTTSSNLGNAVRREMAMWDVGGMVGAGGLPSNMPRSRFLQPMQLSRTCLPQLVKLLGNVLGEILCALFGRPPQDEGLGHN